MLPSAKHISGAALESKIGNAEPSPKIIFIDWGIMTIQGYGDGKDFKLYPGGAEEWNWGKTNTRHKPGIQPQDVQDLLDRGAEFIVLSRGMELVLETSKETIELLERRNMKLGVNYFIEETRKAVNKYNELVEQKRPVGSLIHSTC